MPQRARASIKQRLSEYLAAEQPSAITEPVWRQLLDRLAPVSESYLRQLIWTTGLPFAQPYAGIRQHTFEELEQSLTAMGTVYAAACDAGDHARARYCRRLVIAARYRARFAAAGPRKKEEKLEMAQWMLVWLEDPAMFPVWVQARKKAIASCS